MAWEICMSNDGWDNVRQNLENMNREDLITALTDDDFEHTDTSRLNYTEYDMHYEILKSDYDNLPNHVLVDDAFKRIQEYNTCDNGGHNVWIDVKGYHKVSVDYNEKELSI